MSQRAYTENDRLKVMALTDEGVSLARDRGGDRRI